VLLLPIFSSFFFSLDILVHFDSGVEGEFKKSKFALLFVHWEVVCLILNCIISILTIVTNNTFGKAI